MNGTQLQELRANFLTHTTLDLKFREQQLKSLQRGLYELNPDFEAALHSDLGYSKYSAFIYSQALCQSSVKFMLKNLRKYSAKRKTDCLMLAGPATSYLLPQPLGIVLVMGAWNYPVYLTVPYLVAAIASGNSVVIKPSKSSPRTAEVMCRLVEKYLDPRFYRAVLSRGEEASQLIALPWDLVIYTGGPENGRNVLRGAAENLTKVVLELGGKSPTIVDQDADLRNAALRIAQGKFSNSGQTCIACDHCFVHKAVADKFIKELISTVKSFYGEDPEQSPDYTRIVNQRHCQRLKDWLAESNGEVLLGGKVIKVEDRYFEPTIIKHPDPKSRLMNEEIFGPILPIIEFEEINSVVQSILETGLKPLALYYFGAKNKNQLNNLTNSGAFVVNDCFIHGTNYHQPFGGVQNSGMGQLNGQYSFDTCSHLKPVLEKGTINCFPFSARYPPHNPTKEKVIKMMFNNSSFSQNDLKCTLKLLLLLVIIAVIFKFCPFDCHCPCTYFKELINAHFFKKE